MFLLVPYCCIMLTIPFQSRLMAQYQNNFVNLKFLMFFVSWNLNWQGFVLLCLFFFKLNIAFMLTGLQGFREICWSPTEVKISKQSDFKLYLGEKKWIRPAFLKNLKTKKQSLVIEIYRSVSKQRKNEAAHASVELKVQCTSKNKDCKPCSKSWALL